MKTIIAILFMFIFLSAHTALGEILRLPTLIHHFLEHVEQENASLQTFIEVHYASTIDHPDDIHKDHQNLPFKALDNTHSVFVALIAPTPLLTITTAIFPSTTVKKSSREEAFYAKSYLQNIWQPPRLG